MPWFIIYNERPFVPAVVKVEKVKSFRTDPDDTAIYYITEDTDYEQVIPYHQCAMIKVDSVRTEENGTVLVIEHGGMVEKHHVVSFIRPCLHFSGIESVAFSLERKAREKEALKALAKEGAIKVGFAFMKKDHIVVEEEGKVRLMCNKNREAEFGVVVPEQIDNLCSKCLVATKYHKKKIRFKVVPYEPKWWEAVIGR